MKKNFAKVTALLLVALMLLTACSQGAPAAESAAPEASGAASADAATTPAKDSVIVSIHAEPTTLDPGNAKDIVSQMVQFQLAETLVKKASDDPTKVIPSLAEKWEFSDDGKEIVFTIRQDVKFHNGDTMTMDDVIFSLQRALESPFTSGINDPIESFTKVDDTNVKVTLKYNYAPVMDIISNVSFSVISKKAFEDATAKGEDFGRNPVGTGPYQFVEWQSGNKLVLKAFEEYYGGAPAIKDVTFRIMTDQSTAALSLKQGEIDVLNMASEATWADLDSSSDLYAVDCGSDGTHFVVFNCKEGIFADKRLRQAVSYAINREDIILGGNNGNGVPNECLTPVIAFGYLPEFKNNPYDPEKAKALLAEAGYPDGFTVRFRVNQAATYVKPSEVMQDQLRQVGIILEFDKMERGAYLSDVVENSQFEIAVHMVNASVGDADNVLTRKLHSSMVDNGNNYSKYVNPAIDVLIDDARVETDSQKRLELYEQVYEIMREDAPIIPLFSSSNRTYCLAGLKGVNPQVAFQFRINEWYWE